MFANNNDIYIHRNHSFPHKKFNSVQLLNSRDHCGISLNSVVDDQERKSFLVFKISNIILLFVTVVIINS